jgi:hypothetical protein
MRLPSIRLHTYTGAARLGARFRRAPVQFRMRAMTVIVALEVEELDLQIRGRPEERAIQILAPNGANQPFHEWMRERHVPHGLDFFHIEDSEIGLPLVKPIQGIMVRAENTSVGIALESLD